MELLFVGRGLPANMCVSFDGLGDDSRVDFSSPPSSVALPFDVGDVLVQADDIWCLLAPPVETLP